MTKAASQLERDYDRSIRVLANISTIVNNNAVAKHDASLDHLGKQGPEQAAFDRGCYHGRTHFAKHLLRILRDK